MTIADAKKGAIAKKMFPRAKTQALELARNLRPFLGEEISRDKTNINRSIAFNSGKTVDLWFALTRFDALPRLLIGKQEELDQQSVSQVILFRDALNTLRRSYIDGLAGYYSVANSLLRHFLETVMMAALCEHLAHGKSRGMAKFMPRKLLGLVNQLDSNRKTSIEKKSSLILPEIWGYFETENLNVMDILQALEHWGVTAPYSAKSIHKLYDYLSKFTHQSPARADVVQMIMSSSGRRLSYDPVVDRRGFKEFSKNMFETLDAGIVISLGTLMSFLDNNWQTKAIFEEQKQIILRNRVPLPNAIGKITSFI